MDIFIDKANLLSFIGKQKDSLYADALRLLKRQMDMNFNFKKEEIFSDEALIFWFKGLTEGVRTNTNWDTALPTKPMGSKSYEEGGKGQHNAVFLVDGEGVEKFKESGAVIVGAPDEEMEIFHQLFLHKKDYDFLEKIRIDKMDSWSALAPYALPLTEIVIIDPYLLTEMSLFDSNALPLLKVLASKSKERVSVVIVTHPGRKHKLTKEDIHKIWTKVRNAVSSISKKKPDVTIILTDEEHDRNLVTNYLTIDSGDTFHYWNSNGKLITNGKYLSIHSRAKKENDKMAKDIIADVQGYIKKIEDKNINRIFGERKSPSFIFKDQ